MPPCMSQDGEQATVLFTIMSSGDTFALCDGCSVGWTAAYLQSMTGIDPSPFLAAISDDGGEGETDDAPDNKIDEVGQHEADDIEVEDETIDDDDGAATADES